MQRYQSPNIRNTNPGCLKCSSCSSNSCGCSSNREKQESSQIRLQHQTVLTECNKNVECRHVVIVKQLTKMQIFPQFSTQEIVFSAFPNENGTRFECSLPLFHPYDEPYMPCFESHYDHNQNISRKQQMESDFNRKKRQQSEKSVSLRAPKPLKKRTKCYVCCRDFSEEGYFKHVESEEHKSNYYNNKCFAEIKKLESLFRDPLNNNIKQLSNNINNNYQGNSQQSMSSQSSQSQSKLTSSTDQHGNINSYEYSELDCEGLAAWQQDASIQQQFNSEFKERNRINSFKNNDRSQIRTNSKNNNIEPSLLWKTIKFFAKHLPKTIRSMFQIDSQSEEHCINSSYYNSQMMQKSTRRRTFSQMEKQSQYDQKNSSIQQTADDQKQTQSYRENHNNKFAKQTYLEEEIFDNKKQDIQIFGNPSRCIPSQHSPSDFQLHNNNTNSHNNQLTCQTQIHHDKTGDLKEYQEDVNMYNNSEKNQVEQIGYFQKDLRCSSQVKLQSTSESSNIHLNNNNNNTSATSTPKFKNAKQRSFSQDTKPAGISTPNNSKISSFIKSFTKSKVNSLFSYLKE